MKKFHSGFLNLFRFRYRSITNSAPLCFIESKEDSLSSNRSQGLYCIPAPKGDVTENIDSVVGLQIGLSHISWARIETKTNSVSHLDFLTLPADINKMELHQIYSEAVKTIKNLPSADCYVMESLPKIVSSSSGKLQLTLMATRMQLISMLVTLLNSSSGSLEHESQQLVTFMKPRVTARLFNLLVGSEITASHDVATKLLTKSDFAPFSSIDCTPDLLMRYNQAQNVDKEVLGQALLITIAFIELIYHKNPECYKLLSSDSKKKKKV